MSAPSGPAAKTERLLNLVLVLLYTRRPLSKQQIHALVPQYAESASTEAFDRMFERDKDELRELGVPLVTEDMDALWEDEPGYRIHERDYALPDIDFEPDELAVLGVASRAWAQASLAGPAALALRKLRASGVERDDSSLIGIEPRLRTVEPAFDSVMDAVFRRMPVTFSYRRPESDAATVRHVRPWKLVSWHGRWYLTGFDTDRDAPRVFRLSRIEGRVTGDGRPGTVEVPADHDPHVMVAGTSSADRPPRPAVLRVREGAGHLLRRRASAVDEALGRDGWSLVRLDFSDLQGLVQEVAEHGPDVVALDPPELREAVVRALEGVLAGEGRR